MTIIELQTLLEDAEAGIEIARYDEVEKVCRQVLDSLPGVATTQEALLLRARAQRILAESLRQRGMTGEALPIAESALAVAEQTNSKEETARVHATIGYIYRNLGEYQRSLEIQEHALAEYNALGMKSELPHILNQIGIVYNETDNQPMALEYFNMSLSILEERETPIGLTGYVITNIGNIYAGFGDKVRALKYFTKALAVHEKIGNRAGAANTTDKIAGIYTELRNYTVALEYYSKSLEVFTTYDMKKGMSQTIGKIGWVHALNENFPLALEYAAKALALENEFGLKQTVAEAMLRSGAVNQLCGDFAGALEYYGKTLIIMDELDNKEIISVCLGNIGEMYANDSFDGYDLAKAEEYLLKAISIAKDADMVFRTIDENKALAEIYRKQKRWEDADRHFLEFYHLEKASLDEKAKSEAEKLMYARIAAEREKEIAIAKAATDAEMNTTTTLLHKVLPPSIASRLMKGEKVADYFSQVSILFADIVGFTPIASKMPARKVLAFLNYVFGEFDRIIESHDCEKIKTIGDGYMAVAGAPIECPDHAERIARAAMEMMGDIQLPDDIRSSLPKGAQFSIRIGINSGPVFGGIVGEKRFVYDIYSDSVNTAARMESHGEPGKIHVSEDFAFHLQNRMDMTDDDLGGIVFEEREEMEIKGKGKMKTYFMKQPNTNQ